MGLFKKKPRPPRIPRKIPRPPRVKDPFRAVGKARMLFFTAIAGFVAFFMAFALIFGKFSRLAKRGKSKTKQEQTIDNQSGKNADAGMTADNGATESRQAKRSRNRQTDGTTGDSRSDGDGPIPVSCAEIENAEEIQPDIVDRRLPCWLKEEGLRLYKEGKRREAREYFRRAIEADAPSDEQRNCQQNARNFIIN